MRSFDLLRIVGYIAQRMHLSLRPGMTSSIKSFGGMFLDQVYMLYPRLNGKRGLDLGK